MFSAFVKTILSLQLVENVDFIQSFVNCGQLIHIIFFINIESSLIFTTTKTENFINTNYMTTIKKIYIYL